MKNYGPELDKEIYITCEDDYTHAIILNTAMPNLSIAAKNVLGFACEPTPFLVLTNEFVAYAQKHIGQYFIGDKKNLPAPFIEHHGYLWFDHPIPNSIIPKKNIMSIVFSPKMLSYGHKTRHRLVRHIIERKWPIDIYGSGCQMLPKKIASLYNVKGVFKDTEPYDKYMFTICIENFRSSQYFSEKILTPIMCDTIPVYLGCDNIDSYVGDFCVKMPGIFEKDVALIADILKRPNVYAGRIKTKREEIFERVNLIKNIPRIFENT
jgi:hypothetical protein